MSDNVEHSLSQVHNIPIRFSHRDHNSNGYSNRDMINTIETLNNNRDLKGKVNNQAILFRESKSDFFVVSNDGGAVESYQNEDPDLDQMIHNYDVLAPQDQ